MSLVGGWRRLRVSRPVSLLRYHAYRDVLLRFPRRCECNLCGWRGRHFLTFVHARVLCPQCGSQIRHRLIAAFLDRDTGVRVRTRLEGSVLHLSPEYCLERYFRPKAAEYVRADYATADCDVRLDITDMHPITDGRFDVVVACDVLEHIDDESAALREIHRVLRPGGMAILTVPQFDEDRPTLEDPDVRTPEQRLRIYGQADHVRNYGSDLATRLEDSGFRVTVLGSEALPAEDVERHILRPPAPLTHSWGWNRRRIYFAERAAHILGDK